MMESMSSADLQSLFGGLLSSVKLPNGWADSVIFSLNRRDLLGLIAGRVGDRQFESESAFKDYLKDSVMPSILAMCQSTDTLYQSIDETRDICAESFASQS